MTGPAVVSVILLAAVAIAALVGLWRARRRCVDLGIDKLVADVKAVRGKTLAEVDQMLAALDIRAPRRSP